MDTRVLVRLQHESDTRFGMGEQPAESEAGRCLQCIDWTITLLARDLGVEEEGESRQQT